ncbi:hemolysin family protein [Phaeospirillum tilakii]|uniref:Hemolysin family protein n=1 Tax=Phaeospirillum tilakii TaxID=741673 RepID=A0ABW5CEM0_9PROT
MSLGFEILLILLLIIINGWFAMSELAIVSARRARLAAQAAEGGKGAAAALRLADNPARFLSSVQIGITLVGVLAGAYSGATLAEKLAHWIGATLPVSAEAAEALALALVVGSISYATLIVGELVPKQIALANPERIAAWVARPMALLARLASPLVWLLELSSRLVLGLLRIRPGSESGVTEEEVKAMIAEGTESGVFAPQEREMLSGVMRLADRKVRAVMTPRADIVWLDLDADPAALLATLRASPHSRFPVGRGGIDSLSGVVQAKDLLDRLLDGRTPDLAAAVRPLPVVGESTPALRVLDLLKGSPIHMALVVDEYGAVEGIVTAADLLSSILGSLSEHGEEYEGSLDQDADGSWRIDGDVAIDLAADRLGCPALRERTGDYVTVAGFVLARCRHIPAAGETIECDGWRFEVTAMDGHRIDTLRVIPPEG